MKTKKQLHLALAGQANVGKSVIFNHLTGLHQHIGNWPGKTIEKAEGKLYYKGYTINILDLPGIYSLSTYSIEELVAREYIAVKKPDLVVNVVDATNLERNLIFSLQLLELQRPMILVLNMIDLAKKKGIEIDFKELGKILGVPSIPTVASHGIGLSEVLDCAIELLQKRILPQPLNPSTGSGLMLNRVKALKFGEEVEEQIKELITVLNDVYLPYPKRWLAIKLLEKDKEVEKLVTDKKPAILGKTKELLLNLEKIHGHDSSVVIADERCHLVSRIIKKVVKITKPKKISFEEKLHIVTTHRILGYLLMTAIFGLMFLTIFTFGNWFSFLLEKVFSGGQIWWKDVFGNSILATLSWSAIESIAALIQIALPYILPFYLFLYLLEDLGYLARVSFLMDSFMHKIGVHGKACLPLLLGLGCNVPACLSCRIMETERERFITGFLTTFIPCSAVTVIIMGLVGKFVGIFFAFGLYIFALLIIFVLGRLALKFIPGETTELIMAMPDYKVPSIRTIVLQTLFRLKEFIYIAAPLVVISGVIVKGIHLAGWLSFVSQLLSPITVNWLGLPAITGILLIFGLLRKEMILVMLATLLGTTDFAQVLTPPQMITLAMVAMFYIPCIATIAAFWKQFGWKKAVAVTLFKTFFAIGLGGIVFRILTIFW